MVNKTQTKTQITVFGLIFKRFNCFHVKIEVVIAIFWLVNLPSKDSKFILLTSILATVSTRPY